MKSNVAMFSESLFHHCDDFIMYISTDNKVLELNAIAESCLATTRDDIVNKDLFEFCAKSKIRLPFSQKSLKSSIKNKKVDNEGEILNPGKNKYTAKWKYILCETPQSQAYWLLLGKEIPTLQGRSKNNDENTVFLKNIIENLPEYIYWKDKNLTYQGCNKLVAEYLSLKSSDDIIGKNDRDFGWDEERVKMLYDMDMEVINFHKHVIVEDVIPKPDGSERVMITNKVPLHNESGDSIGVIGISFDITDRKKIEQDLIDIKNHLEDANAAKSDFLSIMAHEIRKPIGNILGLIYLLQKASLTEEQSEMIAMLNTATDSIIPILDYALEFLNIEEGKYESYEELFSVVDLVEASVKKATAIGVAKDVNIYIDIDESVPETLIYDTYRLNQALAILVSNAFRFTTNGFVRITISFDEKMKLIKATIEDTGIGMSQEKIKALFQCDRVLDSLESGLRLSLTRKIIEAIHGRMWAESKANEFTKIYLEIPCKLPDDEIDIIKNSNVPSLRIAVAEQDPMGLEIIGRALKRYGFQVHSLLVNSHDLLTASSITQLVENVDVIMLNNKIPRLTHFLHEIRKVSNGMSDTVMVYCNSLQKNKPLLEGNVFYIDGPIYPSEIKNHILHLHKDTKKILDRVLIVEDDLVFQKIEKVMLEELGYVVDIASTGREALENVKKRNYSLIFLDIDLPDIIGYQLAPMLLKVLKEGEHGSLPKIVAVTSYATQAKRENFTEFGIDRLILKPVSAEMLGAVIDECTSDI